MRPFQKQCHGHNLKTSKWRERRCYGLNAHCNRFCCSTLCAFLDQLLCSFQKVKLKKLKQIIFIHLVYALTFLRRYRLIWLKSQFWFLKYKACNGMTHALEFIDTWHKNYHHSTGQVLWRSAVLWSYFCSLA